MDRVEQALRSRELSYEARRRWAAAQATATPSARTTAEATVLGQVSLWVGHDVDRDELARIVGVGAGSG